MSAQPVLCGQHGTNLLKLAHSIFLSRIQFYFSLGEMTFFPIFLDLRMKVSGALVYVTTSWMGTGQQWFCLCLCWRPESEAKCQQSRLPSQALGGLFLLAPWDSRCSLAYGQLLNLCHPRWLLCVCVFSSSIFYMDT